MDLTRAIKYLSISLLLLNMVFALSIYNDKKAHTNNLSRASMENLNKILQEKNIKLNTNLSAKKQIQAIYKGQYTQINKENFEKIFENFKNVRSEQNKTIIETEANIYPFTNQEIDHYAGDFFEKYFEDVNYELEEYTPTKDGAIALYDMVHEENLIQDSYIKFDIKINGPVTIEIQYISLEKQKVKSGIISPAQAVAKALPKLENKTIEKIQIYHKNTQKKEDSNMTKTTLFPVYIITTADKEKIEIDSIKN